MVTMAEGSQNQGVGLAGGGGGVRGRMKWRFEMRMWERVRQGSCCEAASVVLPSTAPWRSATSPRLWRILTVCGP